MNYFLILIIIGLGWAGYYEYGQLQQQNARDKQEFQDTTNARMTHLEDENTKLQADNDKMTKELAADQAQITTLTHATAAPTNALAPSPVKPPAPSLPSNNLGLIASTDGKNYEKCHLLKIDATGITISYAAGITKVNFNVLPPALQTRFGFDPRNGPVLPETQVATLEQQRLLSEQQATTAGQ